MEGAVDSCIDCSFRTSISPRNCGPRAASKLQRPGIIGAQLSSTQQASDSTSDYAYRVG